MKKTLALVLAALMTAGMTTVAFAASNNNNVEVTLVDLTDGNYLYIDANDDGRFGSADDKFTTNNGVEHLKGAIAIIAPTNDNVPTRIDLSVVKGGKKVAIWMRTEPRLPRRMMFAALRLRPSGRLAIWKRSLRSSSLRSAMSMFTL